MSSQSNLVATRYEIEWKDGFILIAVGYNINEGILGAGLCVLLKGSLDTVSSYSILNDYEECSPDTVSMKFLQAYTPGVYEKTCVKPENRWETTTDTVLVNMI